MVAKRECILFFHGPDGRTAPRAMGGLAASTLPEALAIMEQIRVRARGQLAGEWCCSFAEMRDEGPEHPASCQCRFSLTTEGTISSPVIVQ